MMKIFLSNTENKIDSKGRVSVPSQFRSVLEYQGFAGVYLYPSFTSQSIDGGGQNLIKQISESVERMQLFAEETDALTTALFSETYQLNYDQDGRISLPENLIEHANLKDKVTFAGLGQKFQMWQPSAFQDFKNKARIKALENRDLIGPSLNFTNDQKEEK
ncbi:MAG: division/cell wall cluster transcriptional repressor MraZ [Pseudomonadota bacterium]|nr:division/cell wall cluster transcriptional repressor MraZ [Pseudomonadota bacterium]MEC9382791.1 division/cell wall cluster transcriptional repressor MraZ [Pseudomonadota bacterium]MEC9392778.1 division/cell wall cluster transcriptional repressor MraZ [Pseudomonadota bacterium]MEC9459038.1 division/cell wall cluster transcriptional repressor MraZ [Pseudomonadota bacterium]MED5437133.1 division/cell wall cluster transcriptional repressor MraZ [Pseudomonadota bacterium]